MTVSKQIHFVKLEPNQVMPWDNNYQCHKALLVVKLVNSDGQLTGKQVEDLLSLEESPTDIRADQHYWQILAYCIYIGFNVLAVTQKEFMPLSFLGLKCFIVFVFKCCLFTVMCKSITLTLCKCTWKNWCFFVVTPNFDLI